MKKESNKLSIRSRRVLTLSSEHFESKSGLKNIKRQSSVNKSLKEAIRPNSFLSRKPQSHNLNSLYPKILSRQKSQKTHLVPHSNPKNPKSNCFDQLKSIFSEKKSPIKIKRLMTLVNERGSKSKNRPLMNRLKTICDEKKGKTDSTKLEKKSQSTARPKSKARTLLCADLFPRTPIPAPTPFHHQSESDGLQERMLERMRLDENGCSVAFISSIKWQARAILVDWMIEASEAYYFKRETLYIAVSILDRYIQRRNNLPERQLQLLGTTSLFIAAKSEEVFTPKVEIFSYSAGQQYTIEAILDKEKEILYDLDFKIHQNTLLTWVNLYMTQWDLSNFSRESNLFFKESSKNSYKLYRNCLLLSDLCLLDSVSHNINRPSLAASCLYITLLIFCSKKNLKIKMTALFNNFLERVTCYGINEIKEATEFVRSISKMPCDYTPPSGALEEEQFNAKNSYEEFLSFQSFQSGTLDFVLNRP